jgi:hypothetical protein
VNVTDTARAGGACIAAPPLATAKMHIGARSACRRHSKADFANLAIHAGMNTSP